MPEADHVRILVAECASILTRRMTEEELKAATSVWGRHFADVSMEELSKAVDRWIETVPDRGAFALPGVTVLRSFISSAASERRMRSAHAMEFDRQFTPPSPEFVAAHRQLGDQVRFLFRSVEHDHRRKEIVVGRDDQGRVLKRWTDGGPEGCPVCGPAGDERRQKIAELVAAVPQPEGVGQIPACPKCLHMNGWKESTEGGVYPCSNCNSETFFWWLKTTGQDETAA